MYVVKVRSQERVPIRILPISKIELERIDSNRYFFNWSLESDYEVFQLKLLESDDVLGLVSIDRIPREWRIHIRLLSVSIENQGKQNEYDHIVGNLLTFISKLAIEDYGEFACVSLKPKSEIANHYVDQYGMQRTGRMLSLELPEIFDLLNRYGYA